MKYRPQKQIKLKSCFRIHAFRCTVLIIFYCFFMSIIACNSGVKSDQKASSNKDTVRSEENKKKNKRLSFLDSISSGYELTWRQVTTHALLLKKDITGNMVFTGDTVYSRGSHPIAIINCDDRSNCFYAYLFVFTKDGLRVVDSKIIKKGCDEEDNESSWSLDYSIINDSVFCLNHIYTERVENKEDKNTITKQFFRVTRNGKIDSAIIK